MVEPVPSPLDAGTRLTTTFELLEQILMQLPIETVLFAQRVSQCFRSTIKNSRALQQKLFLAPVSAGHTNDEPQLNPLLTKRSVVSRLPLFLRSIGHPSFITYRGSKRESPLKTDVLTIDRNSVDPGYQVYWQLRQSSRHTNGSQAAIVLGSGSWRDMYLTQPPCMARVVLADLHWYRTGFVTISTGVTMNNILDVLDETVLPFVVS